MNDINEDGDNISLNLLDDTLPVEDWISIENVRSAFISAFESDVGKYPSYDCADSTSALISLSNSTNEGVLNVIKFFRQISEFEELDGNDRLMLIKYNLFPVYPVLKCFNFIRAHVCSTVENDEETAKLRRFYALCFGSDQARQAYINAIFALMETIEQDETVLALLLVILMFSQGLSMNEDEPPLRSSLQVNRVQSHYVQLLWNYMISKWNDSEAHKRFTRLLSIIFQMQKASKLLSDYFYTQVTTSDIVDQITPLMQSVLHIC